MAITPNVVVSQPSQLFTLARSFKANANGKIYIGQIDTDPTIPSNQIQVYLENEDGSHVPVAQPIVINAGGYPVYNGQIAKFVTVQGHSMAIYDAYNVQQFYFPNVLKYDPDQFEARFLQDIASNTGAGMIGESVFGTLQNYLDRNALKLRYETLADLVSGNSYGGPVDFSKLVGKIVVTDFHNNYSANTSYGGGARYAIQTASGYGAVPDGAVVNSVLAGADHYIGGGSAYVAKYLPNNDDGSVDAEAIGLYQGQSESASTTVFEMGFKYCYTRNPVAIGRARYLKLPTKVFLYNNQFEGISAGVYEINIAGSGMPQVTSNISSVSGGTHIKGRMMLNIRSGHFHDFGVDQSGLTTNNDCFKCFPDKQANAGSVRLERILAFGRDYVEATHGIILAGYHKAEVINCQGYYTWYGLSIDANIGIVDGFIGGFVGRNVVNAKSHPSASQASLNKSMTISNVVGFGTTSAGNNVGSAIVALESDGGQVERVTINNVVGYTAYALLAIAPYNGAIMNQIVISNLAGSDFDGPAINIYNSGNGTVYEISISNVSIANLKAQALFANGCRFISIDRLFASKGAAANPRFAVDFVEIASSVVCPELSRITLVDQFNTAAFNGNLLWSNPDATKARRSMMRCTESGPGKPATLG